MSVGILLFLTYTRLVVLLSSAFASCCCGEVGLTNWRAGQSAPHSPISQVPLVSLAAWLWLRLRWRQQEDTTLRCCLLKLICQCQVLCFIFPLRFFACSFLFLYWVRLWKLLRTHLPPFPFCYSSGGTHAAAARNLYQWRVLFLALVHVPHCASAQIRQQLREQTTGSATNGSKQTTPASAWQTPSEISIRPRQSRSRSRRRFKATRFKCLPR